MSFLVRTGWLSLTMAGALLIGWPASGEPESEATSAAPRPGRASNTHAVRPRNRWAVRPRPQ